MFIRYSLLNIFKQYVQWCFSVLNEDLQTYKTKLEADTSGSATTLLSFLTRVNISLTKLFNETQKEWKNSMDSNKRLRVPSFSKDMKLKVRYLHM